MAAFSSIWSPPSDYKPDAQSSDDNDNILMWLGPVIEFHVTICEHHVPSIANRYAQDMQAENPVDELQADMSSCESWALPLELLDLSADESGQ